MTDRRRVRREARDAHSIKQMVHLSILLYMMIWSSCGGILAFSLGKPFGLIGFIVCYLLGVIVAYLLTWLILVERALFFYPLPVCQQGKCQDSNYQWPVGTFYGFLWGVYRYRCKCGDEYVRVGKRFMKLLPDGERRPYKKLTGFRKWEDDQ